MLGSIDGVKYCRWKRTIVTIGVIIIGVIDIIIAIAIIIIVIVIVVTVTRDTRWRTAFGASTEGAVLAKLSAKNDKNMES